MEGTHGNDVYIAGGIHDWTEYHALAGNDVVRMWSGRVFAGPGDDTIERYESDSGFVYLVVAYHEDPGPVDVDLEAGWAADAWGGRDTLINIRWIEASFHGGNYRGSGEADHFQVYALQNFVDGRGGNDLVVLPGSFFVRDPGELIIEGAVDGSSVVLTIPNQPEAHLELHNVERIEQQAPDWNWIDAVVEVVDLFDPEVLARRGLVGLPDQRWNAGADPGTPVAVTFSFTSSGTRSFTPQERQAVRDLLADIAGVTGLSFTEVADGQMRFGISQQVDTKGVSYAPNASGAGEAGDVWMDVESMVDLSIGSEGYAALLHEVGHALGLRHPQNDDPGDAWAEQLSDKHSSSSYTVMGDGSPMAGLYRRDLGPLDILALQYLYGAEPTNTDDSVHAIGGADAVSRSTVMDNGGHDTLDASASGVGVELNLEPFRSSSAGVTTEGLPARDNVSIGAGVWIEEAIGSDWDDLLSGNSLDNVIHGRAGNDWIDGRQGRDTAVFAGARADYEVSQVFSTIEVSGEGEEAGLDVLVSVERLAFADQSLAFDLQGNAGYAAKTLGAVFGGAAVGNALYAGIGLDLLDGGMSYEALMQLALTVRLAGNLSSTAVVDLLYTNVIGVAPSPEEAAPFVALIDNGSLSAAALGVLAAETSFNAVNIGLAGLAETGLAFL